MKRFFSAVGAAVLLCGCGEKLPSMPELPPERVIERTSSTYTGTTVDFIHVSTVPLPRPRSDGFDMPEFPEFDEADDPFDDRFYEMFEGTEVFASMTMTDIDTDELDMDIESTDISAEEVPEYETADVAFEGETETAVTEIPEESAETVTETVTVSAAEFEDEFTEPTAAETVGVPYETPRESDDTADTYPTSADFDIKDYMPSDYDFLEFSEIDIGEFFD